VDAFGTFQDNNAAAAGAFANATQARQEQKMAEHAQRMVELEIKKRRLDLEADGKKYEAEDRRLAAQYQREREKEQHDMAMLRLRLQFQASSGVSGVSNLASGAQFGLDPQGQFAGANTSQFADPSAFGTLGMGMHGMLFALNVLSVS
jgi:hypothetical protein